MQELPAPAPPLIRCLGEPLSGSMKLSITRVGRARAGEGPAARASVPCTRSKIFDVPRAVRLIYTDRACGKTAQGARAAEVSLGTRGHRLGASSAAHNSVNHCAGMWNLPGTIGSRNP